MHRSFVALLRCARSRVLRMTRGGRGEAALKRQNRESVAGSRSRWACREIGTGGAPVGRTPGRRPRDSNFSLGQVHGIASQFAIIEAEE